jgi:hypothetical protein
MVTGITMATGTVTIITTTNLCPLIQSVLNPTIIPTRSTSLQIGPQVAAVASQRLLLQACWNLPSRLPSLALNPPAT